MNRPYDIFGTWFSDQYLISGDLHWLAHLVSTSVLWLNKANQEIDSEHVPIMNTLYKFYNRNASSIRAIMIANCQWLDEKTDPLLSQITDTDDIVMDEASTSNDNNQAPGNPVSHTKMKQLHNQNVAFDEGSSSDNDIPYRPLNNNALDTSIHYLDEYRREFEDTTFDSSDDFYGDDDDQGNEVIEDNTSDDDLENNLPKYLIFSTGAKTYTPHQIGIKRIRNVNFPKKLDPGPSLKERIAAKRKEKEEQV